MKKKTPLDPYKPNAAQKASIVQSLSQNATDTYMEILYCYLEKTYQDVYFIPLESYCRADDVFTSDSYMKNRKDFGVWIVNTEDDSSSNTVTGNHWIAILFLFKDKKVQVVDSLDFVKTLQDIKQCPLRNLGNEWYIDLLHLKDTKSDISVYQKDSTSSGIWSTLAIELFCVRKDLLVRQSFREGCLEQQRDRWIDIFKEKKLPHTPRSDAFIPPVLAEPTIISSEPFAAKVIKDIQWEDRFQKEYDEYISKKNSRNKQQRESMNKLRQKRSVQVMITEAEKKLDVYRKELEEEMERKYFDRTIAVLSNPSCRTIIRESVQHEELNRCINVTRSQLNISSDTQSQWEEYDTQQKEAYLAELLENVSKGRLVYQYKHLKLDIGCSTEEDDEEEQVQDEEGEEEQDEKIRKRIKKIW